MEKSIRKKIQSYNFQPIALDYATDLFYEAKFVPSP